MATPQLPAVNSVAQDVLIVGGVEIPVSGQDVNWSIARAPRGVGVVTNGGQAVWSQSPDNSGVVTVNCSQFSLAHKRLGAVLASMGSQPAAVSVIASQANSGNSASCPDGWIQDPGPVTSQRADGPVTWTIWLGTPVWTYGTLVPG